MSKNKSLEIKDKNNTFDMPKITGFMLLKAKHVSSSKYFSEYFNVSLIYQQSANFNF